MYVFVCLFLILLPAQSFDTEDSGDISRLGTDSETDGWHLQDLEGKASTVSDVMHNLACMFLLSTVCLHDCDHCLITVSLHYHYYFITLSSFHTLQYGDYAAAYSLSPRTQEEEHRPYMLGTPLPPSTFTAALDSVCARLTIDAIILSDGCGCAGTVSSAKRKMELAHTGKQTGERESWMVTSLKQYVH
jgi:hypothetical protein